MIELELYLRHVVTIHLGVLVVVRIAGPTQARNVQLFPCNTLDNFDNVSVYTVPIQYVLVLSVPRAIVSSLPQSDVVVIIVR